MIVTQGTPAGLSATINYAWTGNNLAQNVAAAEYYVDTPPWAGGTAVAMTGSFSGQTVAVSAGIDTAGLAPGRHLIFVRGRGANPVAGYPTWGAVSAAFLTVTDPAGTATASATAGATNTAAPPTATATGAPSSTMTATPAGSTATATEAASSTATATPAGSTATGAASSTATPGAAQTVTVGPSDTATPGASSTPLPLGGTATATSTPCASAFSDVHPSDYFATPLQYLACHGVVSGYGDGTFRPYNNTTRAQMVKIVVGAFNLARVTPTVAANQTFQDVPAAHPFYSYIEAAAAANVVSGYNCGGSGEPCVAPFNRPYFRPSANVTRGQLAKIVVLAVGYALIDPAAPGTFHDVLPNTAFYAFVETATCHGLVSGYACGGLGEPCDAPANRPYFRQANAATRGQIAKIVYNAVTAGPSCAMPGP